MARGAYSKEVISKKIMEAFPDAFIAADGKTIRVPVMEEGERVEVKISLVAAKDCEKGDAVNAFAETNSSSVATETTVAEPTQEELDKVKTLMDKLNF